MGVALVEIKKSLTRGSFSFYCNSSICKLATGTTGNMKAVKQKKNTRRKLLDNCAISKTIITHCCDEINKKIIIILKTWKNLKLKKLKNK